jgi:hypothetical protein
MKPNRWQCALVLLVSFCFLATSCTTTRLTQFPTEQAPNALPAVEIGNTVRVTLTSGEVRKFKVTAIEADGLKSKNDRVPYKDMRYLEVKSISGWRTAGLGLGIAITAVAALYLVLLTTLGDEE